MGDVKISGGGTEAVVQLRGAMTTANFLVDGQRIDPFYTASWDPFTQNPLLERLRGDFLCVPFGITPDAELPEGWSKPGVEQVEFAHGFAAHHDWDVVSHGLNEVELAINYPKEDPVELVTRKVTCGDDGALLFEDRVVTRTDVDLPIGLHPTLRLPDVPGSASLELPGGANLATPPFECEPNSKLLFDRVFSDPTSAPARAGERDLTSLPFEGASEDLVLLLDVDRPEVSLVNKCENYRVTIQWDGKLLKHLMMWISNRGRDYAPWAGQNLCLGLEPITGAFDLGVGVSRSPNPLGSDTTVHFKKNQELVIRHSVRMAAAKGASR